MHFPEKRFKHLVQMVQEPEMTSLWNELRGAVGQLLSKITSEGGRERGVCFPMPQVYGGGELGEGICHGRENRTISSAEARPPCA